MLMVPAAQLDMYRNYWSCHHRRISLCIYETLSTAAWSPDKEGKNQITTIIVIGSHDK